MCGLLVPADPGGGRILCLIKKIVWISFVLNWLLSCQVPNVETSGQSQAQQHSTPGTHSGASVGESHEFERVQDELGQHSQKKNFFLNSEGQGN